MENNNKVTIIIPAYNCEKTIMKTINSIISQDYNNIEIIVVNDGSTDNTPSIVKEIEKNNQNIKLINKNNGGVSSAKNIGIEEANGKYLIFIDSDDEIEEKFISKLIKKAQYSESVLVGSAYKKIYSNGKFEEIKNNNYDSTKDFILDLIKGNIDGYTWRYVFEKNLLKNIRFNENISYMEDTLFLIEYIKNNDISNIIFENEVNYLYYQVQGSITNSNINVEKNIISFYESLECIYNNLNIDAQNEFVKIKSNRFSKILENQLSKIDSKNEFLKYKNSKNIDNIVSNVLNDKNLNLIWKLYIIFSKKAPYVLFRLYTFTRKAIKIIKR